MLYSKIFINREDAGLRLARKLEKYRGTKAVILAVPRGGVPVAYEIAKELELPLDIVLSKKIGHPNNKEYAIGSVSLDSVTVNESAHVPAEYINREVERIRKDLKQRYLRFMGDRKPEELQGKIVIVVDDGIATGRTLLATIDMLRKEEPAKIIIAVPVVPADNVGILDAAVDEFIYLSAPIRFTGVGGFYEDFEQVSDEEVIRLLNERLIVKRTH